MAHYHHRKSHKASQNEHRDDNDRRNGNRQRGAYSNNNRGGNAHPNHGGNNHTHRSGNPHTNHGVNPHNNRGGNTHYNRRGNDGRGGNDRRAINQRHGKALLEGMGTYKMIYEVVLATFKPQHRVTIQNLRINIIEDLPSRKLLTINPTFPLAAGIPKDLAIRLLIDDDRDITALFTVACEVEAFGPWNNPEILYAGQVVMESPYLVLNIEAGEFMPGRWLSFAEAPITSSDDSEDDISDTRIITISKSGLRALVIEILQSHSCSQPVYQPAYCLCGERWMMKCPRDECGMSFVQQYDGSDETEESDDSYMDL
ncbi:Fc.00g041980.m01.CDS01 [Cosmosporella sp. VM-42]